MPPPNSVPSLPSFSLILETENLANADLQGLLASLRSLAAQDPPPQQANEVWLIDSGDTPPELLDQLRAQYDWLQVHYAPPGTSYYTAKMLGAKLATGDIVVYYDSDCIYEPQWLRTLLDSFEGTNQSVGDGEAIQIVAGETCTRGVGPYGTAMALAYIFPPYSGQTQLTPTTQYYLNNVAFRREFLLAHPIPTDLPLYRGNCALHGHVLRQAGHTIWRQPRARATHAPPNGLSHFFWRFLLIGHDYYWQRQLNDQHQGGKSAGPVDPVGGSKLAVGRDRVAKMIAADQRHALFLLLALPIVIVASLLIAIGYQITQRRPHYLLHTYNRLLGE
jgi:glycosyltransferase involved in cell wall biosynthesis